MTTTSLKTTTILLVGAHGFGAVHLRNLERLGPRVELVALADPKGPPVCGFGSDTPCWPTLDAALTAGVRPEIVIIATPTNTHFPLAVRALDEGCDVYLEKPPVASLRQFNELVDRQARAGAAIQVGFQSFGSHALPALASFGPPTSVAAWAAWSRDVDYWNRSAWSGKRALNGVPVVDGVLTNALSHAVATALRVAGARAYDDVARVEVELYNANDIEADDTSSVRITLADRRTVSVALTLASAEQSSPLIEVRHHDQDLILSYTTDEIISADGHAKRYGRTDLLEELLDHRETGRPLSSPLSDSGAFMSVLEAVRVADAPARLPAGAITVAKTDHGSATVSVNGIEHWVERTARAGALFSELRAPFAKNPPDGHTTLLHIDELPIASRNDGSTVADSSAPRPFLHPIQTFGGIVVSEAHPADHDWHLGVSVGIQHVNDVNFWGGRTYTREQGYRWLDDHGRVVTTALDSTAGSLESHARWLAPSGRTLLFETTTWDVSGSGDPRAWHFRTSTTLTAGDEPLTLGSPGTHGREGGGYGGFAWRFPAVSGAVVRTADAAGEDAVHGSTSEWIAFSGRFSGGDATVVLAAADARTRADPWFARVAAYPGIGSALAWRTPVELASAESLTISLRGLVADGRLSDEEIVSLIS